MKKKFRNGKFYVAKNTQEWGVRTYKGLQTVIIHAYDYDKLVYSVADDSLYITNGSIDGGHIPNASKYMDYFKPYITEAEARMYKEAEMRTAERALQGLLSNPSLLPNMDFSYDGMARTACQIATRLVREMIDEEYYDEEDI